MSYTPGRDQEIVELLDRLSKALERLLIHAEEITNMEITNEDIENGND
jgi:hypothetical protein|tara:strand:+ start:1281 stop:1424 length:144 start_codon:yes stop_codon:yes gene_type:complete